MNIHCEGFSVTLLFSVYNEQNIKNWTQCKL